MMERSFEDPAFRLALARKDAELVLEAGGASHSLELPIMEAVTERLRRAEQMVMAMRTWPRPTGPARTSFAKAEHG